MQKEKIHFREEKETMLITLYGRAMDSRSEDPFIRDPVAEEMMRRIDYDFNKLKMRKLQIRSLAFRAKTFDDWTKEFLTKNPEATVLYLGCGLDSRIFRIDPPSGVEWFDVDFPETIELRKRLFPEFSKRAKYHMIGSSVTEKSWLNQIPSDQPVLIIAEGLLYYLTDDQVKTLLKRLVNHFGEGQIIFDTFSTFFVRITNRVPRTTGAKMKWGLNNPHVLEKWMPQVKLITELSGAAMPNLTKIPWIIYQILLLPAYIPRIRRGVMMLRYQF